MPTVLPERAARGSGQPSMGRRIGRSPALTSGARQAAMRIASLTVCQAALIVGFGLLITGPAKHVWPLTAEDHVNEGFERIRTGWSNTASLVGSEAGNTLTVVALTLLVCLGLVLIPPLPRWREAVFLAVAVSLQALVFLAITSSVDRHRPDVHRLDASPPTSSYTSGHTGAATALYGGLAVLALSRIRGPWRRVVAGLLLLVPLLVGVSRLYRGMHHPTDVAGGMLNGALSVLIVGRNVLAADRAPAPPPHDATDIAVDAVRRRTAQVEGRTTVIVNPTVTDEAAREELRLVLEQYGRRDPRFVETTADDPGPGQAAQALDEGASLVVVSGGDGTVRAVAAALAGTGVPLAVVPNGTGNLLARNLNLPLAPAEALAAALGGAPRAVDLGRISGDGVPATYFTAMSGAGMDSAMLEGAGDRAKSTIGWVAYVFAGLRALRTPAMRVTLRLDGAPELRRTARMVLTANIGTVQGGVSLAPDARPDDGLLHVLVVDPQGFGGWLRAVAGVLRGPVPRRRPDSGAGSAAPGPDEDREAAVELYTCRRVEIGFDSPQPREIDGDPVGPGRRLVAEIAPGALTVLLPEGE